PRAVGFEPLDAAIVKGDHVVLAGFQHDKLLEAMECVRLLSRQVAGLGPVVGCVELPHVIRECRSWRPQQPRGAVGVSSSGPSPAKSSNVTNRDIGVSRAYR